MYFRNFNGIGNQILLNVKNGYKFILIPTVNKNRTKQVRYPEKIQIQHMNNC